MGTFDAFGGDDLAGYFDDHGEDVSYQGQTTRGVREYAAEVFDAAAELGLRGVTVGLLIETDSLLDVEEDTPITVGGTRYSVRGQGPADDDNLRTRLYLAEEVVG